MNPNEILIAANAWGPCSDLNYQLRARPAIPRGLRWSPSCLNLLLASAGPLNTHRTKVWLFACEALPIRRVVTAVCIRNRYSIVKITGLHPTNPLHGTVHKFQRQLRVRSCSIQVTRFQTPPPLIKTAAGLRRIPPLPSNRLVELRISPSCVSFFICARFIV